MKYEASLVILIVFLGECIPVVRPDMISTSESFIHNAVVQSKRAFYDSPFGLIHYKYGGYFSSGKDNSSVCCTFLLFHGNPRSIDEFRELIPEMASRLGVGGGKLSFSFIAMDMLGEGHSDDPINVANNSYVSMEQYSDYMIQIVARVLGSIKPREDTSDTYTRYLVPIGSLTGVAIATELSYKFSYQTKNLPLAVENCKILTTILHDPMYYFTSSILASVVYYADLERKWKPEENGQHLLDIWNDVNYQPYKDLGLQDRKSLDRFRAAMTQWQVILGYANYSYDLLLYRLIDLSRNSFTPFPESNINASAPPLLILFGGDFLNDPTNNKIFELQKMKSLIWDAVKDGCYIEVIDGGNQALLSQNVTIVADIVMNQVINKYVIN